MDELQFRKTVAENIIRCRKDAGMTQGALAQKLNYTDKSVSKWERAEGLPDAFVLSEMADIFDISVDELIHGKGSTHAEKSVKKLSVKKKIIPFLSAGIVWLVAAVIFVALEIIINNFFPEAKEIKWLRPWLIFIYAIPFSSIVFTVFSCLWRGMAARCLSVSGIIWGVFLSIILSVPAQKIYLTAIIAAIVQVLAIMWFYMRYRSRLQKARLKEAQKQKSEESKTEE